MGSVSIEGADITALPAHRRGVVLMFQDYALFPHRTVAQNIAFGLRMRRHSRAAIAARVAEMLALTGLEDFADRDVNELSGGERQRVALARSLAPQPRLLLLDEPLGALDRNLRERLLEELPVILRRVGVTAITVTHDQEEAFALSDRVILLNEGRVVQTGRPETLYDRPHERVGGTVSGIGEPFPGAGTPSTAGRSGLWGFGYGGRRRCYHSRARKANCSSTRGASISERATPTPSPRR